MRNTVHVTVEALREGLSAAFRNAGLSPEAAAHTAASLAEAECCGRSSHGIILSDYVIRETRGQTPKPPVIEADRPSVLRMNGMRHMGYHPGALAADRGVEKARETGLCAVTVRNAIHSGMIGFFARRIANAGMWGLVLAHCCPLVAPHGGKRAVFGTNPIALGVPRSGRTPLVLDFSPAAATWGTIRVAKRDGTDIPPGVGLDRDGNPTTDPDSVLDGGTLLPAAGPKGSATLLLAQLFCGALGASDPIPARAGDYGLMFFIFRPDLFQAGEDVAAAVETICAAVTDCPPAAGFEAVRLPGERANRALADALENGVDVDRAVWERILSEGNAE